MPIPTWLQRIDREFFTFIFQSIQHDKKKVKQAIRYHYFLSIITKKGQYKVHFNRKIQGKTIQKEYRSGQQGNIKLFL